MKFAFMLLGNFDARQDRATLNDGNVLALGVGSLEEACAAAKQLYHEGYGCIELCGAFGPEGAQRVIDATENKMPIGYVVHFPQQDELFRKAFPQKT